LRLQEELKTVKVDFKNSFFNQLSSVIGKHFRTDIVVGRFNRSNGDLEFLGSNLTNELMKFVFFADKWNLADTNLSGPAAIAMQTRESVVIQNTSIIYGVITARTRSILSDGGVKGIAAIPLILLSGEEYLIWMQSYNEGDIDDSIRS